MYIDKVFTNQVSEIIIICIEKCLKRQKYIYTIVLINEMVHLLVF